MSSRIQVEVCAYSLASAITARNVGADTIELCGGQAEGGTTPSAGLVKLVLREVSLPASVMIRPRGGDFLYSDTEFEVMCADIDVVQKMGVDGVVLGILNVDGTVDEERTRQLVERARPLRVTFHRAFDMTRDPEEALEAVIRTGATRILTSGQQQRAIDGLDLLKKLVKLATGRIQIVAGSGVSLDNAKKFIDTGVSSLHLSGSKNEDSGMQYRKEGISMASSVPGEYERVEAIGTKIREVILDIFMWTEH